MIRLATIVGAYHRNKKKNSNAHSATTSFAKQKNCYIENIRYLFDIAILLK